MSVSYHSYLAIEKKPAFKGMPLTDLLLAVVLFIVLLLFGAVLLIIGIYTPVWFGFSFLVFIASIFFLKARSRKGQPAFFLSYLSFLFLQPRKLKPAYGKLKLQSPKRTNR